MRGWLEHRGQGTLLQGGEAANAGEAMVGIWFQERIWLAEGPFSCALWLSWSTAEARPGDASAVRPGKRLVWCMVLWQQVSAVQHAGTSNESRLLSCLLHACKQGWGQISKCSDDIAVSLAAACVCSCLHTLYTLRLTLLCHQARQIIVYAGTRQRAACNARHAHNMSTQYNCHLRLHQCCL